MLYLVAVLVSATAFGRGPAIVASVAAFVAFDWWFIEPLHQLSVADPEQYVSLLLFLLVAIVTSQLAAEQRSRTAQALPPPPAQDRPDRPGMQWPAHPVARKLPMPLGCSWSLIHMSISSTGGPPQTRYALSR